MLRFLILGLLRDGIARHGYALMKVYRAASGSQISVGNFYRELQRLVAAGWACTSTNPPGDDPRRTPYRITDAGRAALEAWLGRGGDAGMTEHQDEVALRAFLIAQVGGPAALECLERWQDELAIRRRLCERACAGASEPDGPGFAPLRLLLARRLAQASTDLGFVEQFRAAYGTALAGADRRERLGPRPRGRVAAERRPATRPVGDLADAV